jgi:Protein of unknown function (DUF4232)
MRTGASLGWRIATVVAFGATATLAVVVSRGAPVDAALASANGPGGQHAAAAGPRQAESARCAVSGLRISVGAGARVTRVITRYPLDFTNVSGTTCTLAGYPGVAAYAGDDVQVGAAAGHDLSVAARRIVLAPGQTAHASVDASVTAARCGPVRAAGLRVVAPGQTAARYVRRPMTACAARALRGQDYLRVRPVQADPGSSTGAGVTADRPPGLSAVPVRSASAPASHAHSATTGPRPAAGAG